MRERKWYRNNRGRLARGLPERREGVLPSLDEIDEAVRFPLFDQLAHGKLLMGFYRYVDPSDPLKPNDRHDFMAAMKNKIKRYEETHNLELLLDIANYAKLEFKNLMYTDTYYENEDDTEHAPLKQ